MKKLKKQRETNQGITLIALVITIIVLLILAGISIATLTGENGVLTKANTAKENTRGSSVEEAKNLWKNNQKADKYTENITAQTLDELLMDLRNQNLITEQEKKTIEETGKVTIGEFTIEFVGKIKFTFEGEELMCNEGTTWYSLLEKAVDTPESNKYSEESYNALPKKLQEFANAMGGKDAWILESSWPIMKEPIHVYTRDMSGYNLKNKEDQLVCLEDVIEERRSVSI